MVNVWHNFVLTRNSSRDETANVNFLYDDIAHVLQGTAPPPRPKLHNTALLQIVRTGSQTSKRKVHVR